MYFNVQNQGYQHSAYGFDPTPRQHQGQHSPSNYQSVPTTMNPRTRSSRQSEPAPPYSETDFNARNQLIDRDAQLEYHRRGLRALQMEQSSPCEHSPFEPSFPAQKYDDLLDPSPFRRPNQATATYVQNSISNDFTDLRIQDDVYQKQYSAYAPSDLPQRSPIPAFPLNQQPGYFQQPSQNRLEASPSIASNNPDTLSDQQILAQALAFSKQASTPPPNIRPLRQPIAIPQTVPGSGQAFTHAWAPSLSAHGITQAECLAFIDGLNIVSAANPPLQVLNLAGGIVGMVPHHWAAIAGFAIQATAQLGTAAVSKGRTEMYMKEANEKFFAPRKLKVAIASRDAVGAVLRLPTDLPILAPLTRETMSMGIVERSLAVMTGYAAELDFNVPPPAEQTTVLAKMSAKQLERQGKKNEKKMLKEREKALEKEEKERAKVLQKQEKGTGRGRRGSDSDSDSEDERGPKSRRELKREKSRERKERREEKKAEKEAEKKHGRKGKDKEAEKARKLLWILIENI